MAKQVIDRGTKDNPKTGDSLYEGAKKINENFTEVYEHVEDVTTNPHEVTKAQVGLGNVDNTSDADKPISTATQTALDLKANQTEVDLNEVKLDVYRFESRVMADGGRAENIDGLITEYPNLTDEILVMLPSAFKSGTLYNQRPIQPDAKDFTVVRNSTKDRINEYGETETMGVNVPIIDFSTGEAVLVVGDDVITVEVPVGVTEIIETIDNVEQTPITVIPTTYQIPQNILGSELITNGGFEDGLIGSKVDANGSVSTWGLNSLNPISGIQDGKLQVSTGASSRPYLSFTAINTVTSGKLVNLKFNYKVNSASDITIDLLLVMGAVETNDVILSNNGVYSGYFISNGSSTNIQLNFKSNNGDDLQIDNVSVKEVLTQGVNINKIVMNS